jgi:hypothetical protein
MRINVGDSQWINGRISFHKNKSDAIAEELARLIKGKEKLQEALGFEALEGNSIYEKTCTAIGMKEDELAEQDRELRRLTHIKELSRRAYVSVSQELDMGVTIFVQDIHKEYYEDIKGSVLMKANV